MYQFAESVGKKGKSKVSNEYSITVEEFERIKNILANKYQKCIELGLSKKEIEKEIEKKIQYFADEGFFEYYEIKKSKNSIKIIVNCGLFLYEIKLSEK